MMNKILAMVLMAIMVLSACALAEDMVGNIEDGCYVIQMKVDDLGWLADDMAQDPSVVRLESAEYTDDLFTARYAPVGDGDVTVAVRHYSNRACDKLYTWDLSVADGAVQEVTGGSCTESPDPETFDPYMLGRWLTGDGMAEMVIEKNPSGLNWDVEITAAEAHGAYVFKTTLYYDCELNSFVYDKGKYWSVPITDSDEGAELGEAAVAGTTGSFTITGDEANPTLEWYDDQREGETMTFLREADDAAN